MKPSHAPPRSFSSAGRVSRRAVIGTVALAGALVATVVAAGHRGEHDETEAMAAARQVLLAASAHRGEVSRGCPTLTELMRSGRLAKDARTDDAWGGRFRIVCDASATEVRSDGRDGRAGTADDVRVESGHLGS